MFCSQSTDVSKTEVALVSSRRPREPPIGELRIFLELLLEALTARSIEAH